MTTIYGQDITELRDLCTIADIHKWFIDRGFTHTVEDQDSFYIKRHDYGGFDLCFMLSNTTKVPYDTDLSEHCLYLCTHFDDGKVDPLLPITKSFREEING